MTQNLEVGDIVLCTVEKIEGTIVFVKIHDGNQETEGTITISEIAPGRIRNLRNYVVPKKKIACKVLRITENRIDLSLRRVTPKERKEVMEQYKQEKSYISILKRILGDKADEVIDKISSQERIYDFFEEVKENPEKLKELVSKEDAEKILDIINTQKQKKVIISKQIALKTTNPDGLEQIKRLFDKIKEGIDVRYLASGKYILKTEASDAKKADHELKEVISNIEKKAKNQGIEFTTPEK